MKFPIALVILLILFTAACRSNEIEQTESNDQNNSKLISVNDYLNVPEECAHKILSGKLIEQMSKKIHLFEIENIDETELVQKVFIYLSSEPSIGQKDELNNLALKCDWESWSPPAANHPLGLLTAEIKIELFKQVLCLEWIKKIDTAEREVQPD
ncbi:MAG: hypothetical protein K8F36_05245 [Melioribacteraceae bacterium]|nr:hypothetical protein [Melioribacteraceae bacterium]